MKATGGASRVVRRILALARRLAPTPHTTPLTFCYLVLLLVTTFALWVVDAHTRREILISSSTDAAHLSREPVKVLVASALWLPALHWLPFAVIFSLVLAAVERRVGWAWTIAMFLSGHIVATLATELPIELAVDNGWLPAAAAHRIDVGISYGFYACLGALLGMMRPRPRWLLLAAAAASVLVPLARDVDVTTAGHLLSLLCGLAWWPWLRRRRLFGVIRVGLPHRLK